MHLKVKIVVARSLPLECAIPEKLSGTVQKTKAMKMSPEYHPATRVWFKLVWFDLKHSLSMLFVGIRVGFCRTSQELQTCQILCPNPYPLLFVSKPPTLTWWKAEDMRCSVLWRRPHWSPGTKSSWSKESKNHPFTFKSLTSVPRGPSTTVQFLLRAHIICSSFAKIDHPNLLSSCKYSSSVEKRLTPPMQPSYP